MVVGEEGRVHHHVTKLIILCFYCDCGEPALLNRYCFSLRAYGLEIEYLQGACFSALIQTGCGAHSASSTMGTVSLFPR